MTEADTQPIGEYIETRAEVFEGLFLDRDAANRARLDISRAIIGMTFANEFDKKMRRMIRDYFRGIVKNAREERRFLKRNRLKRRLRQMGFPANYAIPRAQIMDVRLERQQMAAYIREIARLASEYKSTTMG